jgi:hypothetical protein
MEEGESELLFAGCTGNQGQPRAGPSQATGSQRNRRESMEAKVAGASTMDDWELFL